MWSSRLHTIIYTARVNLIASFLSKGLLKVKNNQVEKNLVRELLYCTFKGTVRPDWICMRVVPLDRP
jgi:hypothetical protein